MMFISINKGVQRITHPPSKLVPRFTSFPGSPESTVTVKVSSNVWHYNLAPLVPSTNSYRLIVSGCTPNVHLITSGNANDQTNISATFPSLLHNPSGNTVTPFRVVTHLPSSPKSPNSSDPSLGKAFSHRKIQNQGIYMPQPSYQS